MVLSKRFNAVLSKFDLPTTNSLLTDRCNLSTKALEEYVPKPEPQPYLFVASVILGIASYYIQNKAKMYKKYKSKVLPV